MACARHPEAEVFHSCTLCASWWCEPCLRPLETPGSSRPILTCPGCGGLVRVAVEIVPSEGESLREQLRLAFGAEAALMAFVLSLPIALTIVPIGITRAFFTFVYLACVASYVFQTIEHVGQGRVGLPFSAEPISRGDLFAAVGRGLACLAVVAGPAFGYRILVPDGTLAFVGLLALGLGLMPAAMIAAAVSRRARAALWPFAWARIMSRAPAAYARLVGVVAAACAAWGVVALALAYTVALVPLVGPVLVAAVHASMAILLGVLVGGFLRRNADDLGYR